MLFVGHWWLLLLASWWDCHGPPLLWRPCLGWPGLAPPLLLLLMLLLCRQQQLPALSAERAAGRLLCLLPLLISTQALQ
jgi:hypothetical protein